MRIATMHPGRSEFIAKAREALEQLVDGDWTGDGRWGSHHGWIAARRQGRSLSILPDGNGTESRRIEMTWRKGRTKSGTIEFNCPIDLVPRRKGDRAACAETMDEVRQIARWLLTLLAPDVLIDVERDGERLAEIQSMMDRHQKLCAAVSTAFGDIPLAGGTIRLLSARMASPWAQTKLFRHIPHPEDMIPDDMQALIRRSAERMPLVCEVDRNAVAEGRGFHVVLRPITTMLERLDMVEAMRRIAQAAA